MKTIAERAHELWQFTCDEFDKADFAYTGYTVALVALAALVELYDSGIVPDSVKGGNEDGNSAERDIAAIAARLEKENWR